MELPDLQLPPAALSAAAATAKAKKAKTKAARAARSRPQAVASNAKRKGQIKQMEAGLERTRRTVATLEESVRQLEKENRDLRRLLGS